MGWTNAGLNLIASAVQVNGAQVAVTYVSVGLGAGTLNTGLTSGNTYTSLTLASALTVGISLGQSLTLVNPSGGTQTVITSLVAHIGDTTINVNSFIASANFPVGSGVVNTPAATDTALQNETWRVASIVGTAGGAVGESLSSAYIDPTATSATYIEVGYWGGSTATATLGTGTLIARDVRYWSHVNNADSATYQLDSIL